MNIMRIEFKRNTCRRSYIYPKNVYLVRPLSATENERSITCFQNKTDLPKSNLSNTNFVVTRTGTEKSSTIIYKEINYLSDEKSSVK